MKTKVYIQTLICFLYFNICFSQWNSNTTINTQLINASNIQRDISISNDKKNGAILIWEDLRSGIAEDVYAQRVNSNGIAKWATNGVAVCTALNKQNSISSVEDGNGGVIITWDDYRSGNSDIYIQKLDSNGVAQWATNGVAVCTKSLNQESSKIISDGAGGAIVVWEDSINGALDIFAQRINSSGVPLWTTGGVAICTAPLDQIRPRLQPDNLGGAFIVWQDRRGALNYDIYAQHINASGIVMWPANGIVVCNAINTQTRPKLRGDGNNGVIIAWQDKRNALDFDLYAQRLDALGNIKWAANGIVVCNATGNQEELDLTNENIPNGIVICWTDHRSLISNNSDIYIQKIDTLGNNVWASNGVALSSSFLDQKNSNIVGDGTGGAIVVWQDSIAGNQWDIRSQKVNSNGLQQWALNGIAVSDHSTSQTQPVNISSFAGSCIYAWEDNRNGIEDIYIHRLPFTITSFNTNKVSDLDFKIYPNPFNESTNIFYKNTSEFDFISVEFSDLTGKKVELNYNIINNNIKINRNNIPAGIYFYNINLKNINLKGKLIISDY
ncbi:MAG: T9SS type A sorting domain-containing protein [Bacteroidetes bacterium]|nr:T9SS type A sorting domain-containing protein [Bacteroidota bacterium]